MTPPEKISFFCLSRTNKATGKKAYFYYNYCYSWSENASALKYGSSEAALRALDALSLDREKYTYTVEHIVVTSVKTVAIDHAEELLDKLNGSV